MKFTISDKQLVPIHSVFSNDGQVEGLPKNPRFIKDGRWKKLVTSIKEFPEMREIRPIIVNEQMVILGGNMRHKAYNFLEYTEVYIQVVSNLSIAKQKEFIFKDNQSYGSWDLDELYSDGWGEDILEHWGYDELVKPDDKLSQKELDSKYDDTNCVYPIIPFYDEKHNAFIIIVESETEEAAIRTKFNFPKKAQSYKNTFKGKSYILSAKDILNG